MTYYPLLLLHELALFSLQDILDAISAKAKAVNKLIKKTDFKLLQSIADEAVTSSAGHRMAVHADTEHWVSRCVCTNGFSVTFPTVTHLKVDSCVLVTVW
jgi:hypothetical protein